MWENMVTRGHGTRTWAQTQRDTQTQTQHREGHRHETFGYRHGGTVHVSGCTHRTHMDSWTWTQCMQGHVVRDLAQADTHRDTWIQ